MDPEMHRILLEHYVRDDLNFLEAFYEGLALGRIWEL
jgi:hypothetical protein